ncbi:outer membrane lipoprotein carrier protein LolA [Nannocystis sp. SCPEA4]|uniref:outer membrane lipoprotein carrier protein LolA n=1 Tax=Nannocystis sp. SCPEA4 TaxID=2996787 RepID=UPI00226FB4DB|nr:outer membrane lipoprotein carrier protein LolA [Nannocystis sp. SCPEA4]MCY1062625.1 outer membrane lipoprotein carrier protein LolA [Nannocystis sp. SCPEA4]
MSLLSLRTGPFGHVLAVVVVMTGSIGQAGATDPLPVAAAPVPAALTLEQLLGRFAGMSGLQAAFREEKRMALLAAPLVNEGTIYFVPNGKKSRLARHTAKPARSVVVIDGSALRMADDAGREEIALDKSPAVRLFVDSFVRIFAGDGEALATMYAMELKSEGQRWTLKLKPKLAPLDKLIERVEIAGEGIVIATMRVVEIGGDEAVTTFSAVDPQRKFTAEEQTTLFSLPPKPAAPPPAGR